MVLYDVYYSVKLFMKYITDIYVSIVVTGRCAYNNN